MEKQPAQDELVRRYEALHPTVRSYLASTRLLSSPENMHPSRRFVLEQDQHRALDVILSSRELYDQLGEYVEFRDQKDTEVGM